MGKHQVNIIQCPLLEQPHKRIHNLAGPLQRGVLGSIHELPVNGDILFLKIVAAHLANQKQGGVLLPGQVALCQFQNIVVVSAGQALVSRNHHKARLPLFLGLFMALDIPVLQVWGVAENIQDGLCQPVKIGLHL